MSNYYSAVVTISGATNNQNFTVQMQNTPGASWSVGDPSSSQSTGLNFSASGGTAVPLNSFGVNGTNMVLNTSVSGSDTVTITINAYVYFATPTQYLTVGVIGDTNVSATFAFTGNAPKPLTSTGTIIPVPA